VPVGRDCRSRLGLGSLDGAGDRNPPLYRLRRAIDYIREHLDQEITLARLGAVVCMSPYHSARLCHRTTGLPAHRFVVRARIDRVSALLATSELAIAAIAKMVGFRTASHFSTVFHRITGVTPRENRGRHRLLRGRSQE
jgi:AraC family transcriptional regulator